MIEDKKEKRAFAVGLQAREERKEERKTGTRDFWDITKSYRESYLDGLEVALKGQVEVEKLIREASHQGFAVWKEWIKQSREWAERWPEIKGGDLGNDNPWLAWSKECNETACGAAELLLRATEEVFNSGFSLYEKAVAEPFRKSTRQVTRQWIDGLIPG